MRQRFSAWTISEETCTEGARNGLGAIRCKSVSKGNVITDQLVDSPDLGKLFCPKEPSLAVPESSANLRADEAMQYGAIALFVDRAQSVDNRFALSDGTAPIVADVCRRLDGIPLAIELAAARLRTLSIANLSQRLSDRFKLLTGGRRDAVPRQRTLGALIDWSYDLLEPREQLLFTRLGIFSGEFGLNAAAAVCAGAGLDESDILDMLCSLSDKSLLVADTTGAQERYRLFESTSAYALERLTASGQHAALARRHAEYFLDEVRAAKERFGADFFYAWVPEGELDLDNYRAALEWGLTQRNDAVLGAAIVAALEPMWRKNPVEGRYWNELVIERVRESEHPGIVAGAYTELAALSAGQPSYEFAMRALHLYELAGPLGRVAKAQYRAAITLAQMGRLEEANEWNARSLATARECGDERLVAANLSIQAWRAWQAGKFDLGRELYAQAYAAYKALGYEPGMALALGNLAELEFNDGRPGEALRLAGEALAMKSHTKANEGLSISHGNIAAYRIALDDLSGARASAREALRLARKGAQRIHHRDRTRSSCRRDGARRRASRRRSLVGLRRSAVQCARVHAWPVREARTRPPDGCAPRET
jgi:predicted ATPase